jgi:hypothetical protein
MSEFDVRIALKAAQWEKAKGELRALVALQGSYPAGENTERWKACNDAVEAFVDKVEFEGLAE